MWPYLEVLKQVERFDGGEELSNLDQLRVLLVSGLWTRRIERRYVRCVQTIGLMLLDQFGDFELGSGRIAYIHDDDVYKLAFNSQGATANQIEAQGVFCGVPIAAAQWVTVSGVALLQMERVDPIDSKDRHEIDLGRYPWVPLVDQYQIGWTKAGDLVCYDAGQLGEFNRGYW